MQVAKRRPKHSKLNKMRRQRYMQQLKEQGKNPPDQTNEKEIGSLLEKEFRRMIVKSLVYAHVYMLYGCIYIC